MSRREDVYTLVSCLTVAELRAEAQRRRKSGEHDHAEQLESVADTQDKATPSERAHLETLATDLHSWSIEIARLGRQYGFYPPPRMRAREQPATS